MKISEKQASKLKGKIRQSLAKVRFLRRYISEILIYIYIYIHIYIYIYNCNSVKMDHHNDIFMREIHLKSFNIQDKVLNN